MGKCVEKHACFLFNPVIPKNVLSLVVNKWRIGNEKNPGTVVLKK
jgi:hypothetical protein